MFRKVDKILIVEDAFTATKQESLLSVIIERDDVKGPPAYLTTDWSSAKESIVKLKNLNPDMVLPSHGDILKGIERSEHLEYLLKHFDKEMVPENVKFIN